MVGLVFLRGGDLSFACEDSKKEAVCMPGRGLLPECSRAGTLVLDVQHPELME